MRNLSKRLKIKFLKILRKYYQSLYLFLYKKRLNSYENKVELIKNEFKYFYFDIGPEHGILEGLDYAGANTHCTQCLYTLTRLTAAKNILEIGSYHYKTTNQIGTAIDDNYGKKTLGTVVTFDIIRGGIDSGTEEYAVVTNSRVNPNFWYPYKTKDTNHIDNSKFVLDNSMFTNEEIVNLNKKILRKASKEKGIDFYDLIFIDGDHSYEGISNDFNVISEFSNKNTLIVVDNIWDERLIEVKEFFDNQPYIKWNFKEFNDNHYAKNKVQDTGVLIIS